jgi:hypothetical protein
MDAEAMSSRCPGAKMLGRARLPRHRIALLPDGFATVVRDAGAVAHGVLWDLSFGDLAALDRYEGAGYVKVSQRVLREGSSPVRAMIYIGRSAGGSGRAPADYLTRIVAVARDVGLPNDHIDFLRRLAGVNPEPALRYRAIKNPKLL